MSLLLFINILWQISTLAFVALGLAIIFGQLKILNMAHGELVMIGAYSAIITQSLGLPPFLQLPVCILVSATVALIIEITVIRHFYNRLFDSLLASWAIGILLREIIITIFSEGFQNVPTPIVGTTPIFGTHYPSYRLVVIAFILVFFMALYFWYRHSRFGIEIKAMVQNPELAATMGINVVLLSRFVFIFGAVSAAIAGWLLAPTVAVWPFMGLDYLIRSFFALVVGGMGSLEGLLLGSAIIAGLQSYIAVIFDQISAYIFILLLSILFLWKRPNGIISSY